MNKVFISAHTHPCKVTNRWGQFNLVVFRVKSGAKYDDVAAVFIDPKSDDCLLRINSACVTSESFGDTSCDCKWQLDEALRSISEEGSGMVLYVPSQEGRGIGLFNKARSLHLMHNENFSTAGAFAALGYAPDLRTYEFVEPILKHFGVRKVRLITNNPDKIAFLQASSVEVIGTVPIVHRGDKSLSKYLNSKRVELGHIFDEISEADES